MIPVMAAPVIPPEPQAPDLASQLPPTITLTPDEVAYYKEVCDAWESNDYTKEHMEEKFPGLPRAAVHSGSALGSGRYASRAGDSRSGLNCSRGEIDCDCWCVSPASGTGRETFRAAPRRTPSEC